jgi:hypothetical protein
MKHARERGNFTASFRLFAHKKKQPRSAIMRNSYGKVRAGIAVAALLAAFPAFAQSANDPAASGTTDGAANSGPGVQGPPDTRTGPSTKGSEGTSSGETGSEHSTTPSQDSSGVEGLPGNKSGPAVKEPSDSSSSSTHKKMKN